jgi:general secretion pathway protein E
LVLSTLHTNDAASAMTRLLDLGVPVLSDPKRADRRDGATLGAHPVPALQGDRKSTRLWEALVRPWPLPKPAGIGAPQGCPECRNTGYLGRVGLYELLSGDAGTAPPVAGRNGRGYACGAAPSSRGCVRLRVSAALQIAAGT